MDIPNTAEGVITITRFQSTPQALFGSDTMHTQGITLTVNTARVHEGFGSDTIFPEDQIVRLTMSQAQWAAVVSSVGLGSGVPVTLDAVMGSRMPEVQPVNRLEKANQNVEQVIEKTLAELQEQVTALGTAIEDRKGIKELRNRLNSVKCTMDNLPRNASFAVEVMQEAAEKVLGNVRADIEAMAMQAQAQASTQIATATPSAIEAD